MGAAPVPKFVLSHALDFPDICLQFFTRNFSRQEEKCFTHNTVYFLASHAEVLRGSSRVPVSGAGTRDEPLRTSSWEAIYFHAVKMTSKTVMIRFSAPFRISAPFECVFVNKRPYPYKSTGTYQPRFIFL